MLSLTERVEILEKEMKVRASLRGLRRVLLKMRGQPWMGFTDSSQFPALKAALDELDALDLEAE